MGNLDISSVIDMFACDFQVERRPDGEYVDGVWQGGDADTTTQSGSVTPATANDLIKLPEGERQRETLRLITRFKLNISKNSAETDIVIYLGHRYRVFGPSMWEGNGFYDVLIQKEDNA